MALKSVALNLVTTSTAEPAEVVSFCSHCGSRPVDTRVDSRVCSDCSLGLMLLADPELAPAENGAFLVLDRSMCVCAVSRAAEDVLGISEPKAINRHVTELLVPADAEAQNGRDLAVAVTWAARGDRGSRRATVRPTNVFGVRLRARVGSCGPPTAALIVFE